MAVKAPLVLWKEEFFQPASLAPSSARPPFPYTQDSLPVTGVPFKSAGAILSFAGCLCRASQVSLKVQPEVSRFAVLLGQWLLCWSSILSPEWCLALPHWSVFTQQLSEVSSSSAIHITSGMFSGMSHHKGLECWPSMFYQCLNGLKKVFGKQQMPLERREREKKIDLMGMLRGQLAQDNRKKCNSEVGANKQPCNPCLGR